MIKTGHILKASGSQSPRMMNIGLFLPEKKVKKPQKGPFQLDLFEPASREYQYKEILTNKTESARTIGQL